MTNVRTDLALEAKEIYQEKHRKEKDIDGIEVINEIDNDIKVTTVKVKDENGARKIGKPKGNYVTIDIPEFTAYDGETMDRVSQVVSEILGRMINIDVEKNSSCCRSWELEGDSRCFRTKSNRRNNGNKTLKNCYARNYG